MFSHVLSGEGSLRGMYPCPQSRVSDIAETSNPYNAHTYLPRPSRDGALDNSVLVYKPTCGIYDQPNDTRWNSDLLAR